MNVTSRSDGTVFGKQLTTEGFISIDPGRIEDAQNAVIVDDAFFEAHCKADAEADPGNQNHQGYAQSVRPSPKVKAKLTIAKTGDRVIRCTGKLACECGTQVQASDFRLDEDDDEGIIGLTLVCSGCHADLVEVTEC